MKIALTNSDVTVAITAYIATQFPALAGADVALDYTLSRGVSPQLTIDLHIGADAEAFRATQEAKPAPKPFGRKPATTTTVALEVEDEDQAVEAEVEESEVVEEAPAKKRFAPRKAAV